MGEYKKRRESMWGKRKEGEGKEEKRERKRRMRKKNVINV